ncbi:uncharacterized protein LOC132719043 [Ruditapes philippinarum]|uniref:uncharacterized protein LOC132719043 n=1 Tax=Ruditapes philippinarum TaxID=129788 RepID=UPI00295B8C25|nr:uncharacterized protein LOC132719043 [Ruditapes philippinarum]
MDKPISGVVYNTPRHRNAPYQSSTTTIGLSWHGFQDKVSGVRTYYAAISDRPTYTTYINFISTGLSTKHIFRNLDLKHGPNDYGFVKCVDNVGHQSLVAVSDEIKIDTTPPTAYTCQRYVDIKNVSGMSDFNDNTLDLSFNASLNTLYKIVGYMPLDGGDEVKLVFHFGQSHTMLQLMKYHNQTLFFEHSFFASTTGFQTISIEKRYSNTNYFALNMTLCVCVEEFESNNGAITLKPISREIMEVRLIVKDTESPISKVQIGAGTTPRGFQVKSLSRVHHLNHNHLIQTNVQHGTNVYVTAIVENKAGLRTVVQSKPITIDHTKPVVKHLNANLRYVQENESGVVDIRAAVHASWEIVDDESGISICYCSIGQRPGLHDISSIWIAENKTSCESNRQIFTHGQTVFLNLKCFNEIGLSTEDVAGPLVVSLQQSKTSSAELVFIPQNEGSNGNIIRQRSIWQVQSNNTCLVFKWGGFSDLSGIVYYEYRVYQNEHNVLKEWEKTEKDMAKVENIGLRNGEVIAEVRAINIGSFISHSVNASLLVARYPPTVTGFSANFTRQGEKLHLSWADVFDTVPGIPFSFSLTIGTRKGYTDILDINYIGDDNIDVSIPKSTIITPTVKEVFLSIDCIYETGLQATYNTSYKLD